MLKVKFLNLIDRFLTRRIEKLAKTLDYIKKTKYFLQFEDRDDDIFVITFLKSGTTWVQMILYQMLTDGCMDFEHIYDVSPWITNQSHEGGSPDKVNKLPSPRIIKTHDPYQDFDENFKGKFIYVFRDGRDVAVSLYHHVKNYNNADLKFDENFKKYFSVEENYNWFTFSKSWLENKNNFNILYIKYSDLKDRFEETIKIIAHFLAIELDENTLQRIKERSSFSFMKQYESKFGEQPQKKDKRIFDQFIRKGEVGEGEKHLNESQTIFFERMYEAYIKQYEHKLYV